MRERNRSVDLVRAIACMLVVVYHGWVVCGSQTISWPIINMIITLGGEIGVATFFILSGYGIYCSLYETEKREKISFCTFYKKRAFRILPQYYFCLFVVVLLTEGACYLSADNIGKLVSHILFIHNFWPSHFGAINGVLWTMAIIVQFYLFAIPLYRGVRKFGVVFWVGSIIVTICIKCFTYVYIVPQLEGDSAYLRFIYGRQFFTALDNFVIGMAAANLVLRRKKQVSILSGATLGVTGIVILLIVCKFGQRFGIHTNNFSGYIWHSGIAVALLIFIVGVAAVPINSRNIIIRAGLRIASCEYGIYLWHLVVFNNLIDNAPFVRQLIDTGNYKLVIIIFSTIAIGVGYIFTRIGSIWRPSSPEEICRGRK